LSLALTIELQTAARVCCGLGGCRAELHLDDLVARRWKLPDGRTSLQAYRDQQR